MRNEKVVYIHVGCPKTGTSFLQSFCYVNRDLLREYGIEYSARGLRNGKHQWLVDKLVQGGLRASLLQSNSECGALFSAEGIITNLFEIAHFRGGLIIDAPVVVIMYERNEGYIESLYKQVLINPVSPVPTNPYVHAQTHFSTSLTLARFRESPWAQYMTDFDRIAADLARVFGKNTPIRRLNYSRTNLLINFLVDGLDLSQTYVTEFLGSAAKVEGVNVSISNLDAEIIRRANSISYSFAAIVKSLMLAGTPAIEYMMSESLMNFYCDRMLTSDSCNLGIREADVSTRIEQLRVKCKSCSCGKLVTL